MWHGRLKKVVLVLLLASVSGYAGAQQDSVHHAHASESKLNINVIANAGLLVGASSRDVQLQAIGGILRKNWYAGIGSGVDYYFWRTVPLFVDVRKTFSKSHAFFAYADAGANLPWIKEEGDSNPWFRQSYKRGVYYDVGIGREFKITQRSHLLCSAGYSGKTLTETQTSGTDKTELTYNLRRISIKFGFRF